MNSHEIGRRLRKLRGNKSITEVADCLGVGKSTVYMWEIGERVPRDEMKLKIAKLYGKAVEDIFFT